MIVINWFKKLLTSLNLFKKEAKIAFLGLENAGKSSLLIRMKHGKFVQVDPTINPKSEIIEVGKVRFKAFDLGGHDNVLKLWGNYYPFVDAIIFMVDASCTETLPKAADELWKLLENPKIKHVPILIFGNKIDKGEALDQQSLREALGISSPDNKKDNNLERVEVFMCSVAKNIGILDGFKWLNNRLP